MKETTKTWIDKGYRWAYTLRGEDLPHALTHKLVAVNESAAIEKAQKAFVQNKSITIFSLENNSSYIYQN
jgi:hypothetical protein